MEPILSAAAAISLDGLGERIRRSSNFRFEWQWFSLPAVCVPSPAEAHRVLDAMVADPLCHGFLQRTFVDLYDGSFKIDAPHLHCRFEQATDEFHQIVARAATDRLGAHSRVLGEASASEVKEVRRVFAPVLPYSVFALTPGEVPGCAKCKRHDSHVFTTWFYGVAWDWCFCLLPHGQALAWLGFLTDTD